MVQLEEPLVQVDIDLIEPRRGGLAHRIRQELLEGLGIFEIPNLKIGCKLFEALPTA